MTALLFMFLQMTLLKDAIEISFYYTTRRRRRTMGKTSEMSLCSCLARRPPVFLRRTQKEGVNLPTKQRYCPLLPPLLCVTLLMDSFVSEVLELPCAKSFHLGFEK